MYHSERNSTDATRIKTLIKLRHVEWVTFLVFYTILITLKLYSTQYLFLITVFIKQVVPLQLHVWYCKPFPLQLGSQQNAVKMKKVQNAISSAKTEHKVVSAVISSTGIK